MTTYPVELFMRLVEVFPDAMNTSRVIELYEDRPGRFGMERVAAGYSTKNLGTAILDTANAIMIKYGQERALRYIDSFKPEKIQHESLRCFNRRA